jgi:essential nuclear protein 1
MFLPKGGAQSQGQTLADVILSKIKEHEERGAGGGGGGGGSQAGDVDAGLSPKVMQVYGDIGKWLAHYKQGKVPKAFKVIPSLSNWEEVLSLTNPLGWSPAAMYEAVKIFASSLNPKMAQRFFNLVLLPAVRQNVAQYKRLNFHYYRSVRKCIFKPAAFFKGIVLPLAGENCTLREAVILSSVLGKASIPGMHVAAALVHLSRMSPWYGTTSILIAALVNKKCALPLQVLECLVAHFYAFVSDSRVLPLVWHRALLIFVQRSKFELNDDQRRRIRDLLKVHCHEAVGAEIRRELLAPRPGAGPADMDMS